MPAASATVCRRASTSAASAPASMASSSVARRRVRRAWKYARASSQLTTSRITPFAFMRPERSCRSANSCATCVYIGSSCASLVEMSSSFSSGSWSSSSSTGSSLCIAAFWSLSLNFTSQMPGGSRIPPRLSTSAYISMRASLMVGSTTTHAPPLNSPFGGMYTNTGWRYTRSSSTIIAPNLRISPYMSRVPPENPRQLAKMISGKFSALLKSRIAVAVLCALSGNHTWPACAKTVSRDSGLAGSAGMRCSIRRVSTAITPMGTPPKRARPHTTDLPQSASVSVHEPLSKNPDVHSPSAPSTPAIMCRGSYGVLVGLNSILRSIGSALGSAGERVKQSLGT
mmetsp:Transcript_12096/g.51970  ORF Transcript_12096/g.51970 Transcript_12096/m.51970 type:complete len:341 (+) Transcript_12096:260-1282(+)